MRGVAEPVVFGDSRGEAARGELTQRALDAVEPRRGFGRGALILLLLPALLIAAIEEVEKTGAAVLRILAITGLDLVFPSFPSLEEAIAQIPGAAGGQARPAEPPDT